jgi:DNA-binding NtrC family response regulator
MDRPAILIIDDDINLRKTLSDILQSNDYESVSARNCMEGISLLGKCDFNVVLIDLGLTDCPAPHRIGEDQCRTDDSLRTLSEHQPKYSNTTTSAVNWKGTGF